MSSKLQNGPKNGVNHTTDANEFFSFYSQLHQSCIYYSNLAMRQMMVGYHNLPVGAMNLPSQLKGDSDSANVRAPVSSSQNSNIRRMLDFDDEEDEKVDGVDVGSDGNGNRAQGSFKTSQEGNARAPVTVIVSNYDDDSDSGEMMGMGLRQQRRVNFANPLSTVKFKSPTPMHSTEELNAHTDSTRTGFTSDSEEGSDTEILCNYFRRVQSQSLQPNSSGQEPGGEGVAKKRKKRRKRNKNKKNQQQDGDINEQYQFQSDCPSYWPFEVEMEDLDFIYEDDPNAIYEMPLNEDDYEFISEIRKCGDEDLTTKKDAKSDATGLDDDGGSDKLDEMKMLYGESGSARILKMEEAIEKSFLLSMRKIYNPKY